MIVMNYDSRKIERDKITLKRVKQKINAYNTIKNPSGPQKLKIMALISQRQILSSIIK